MTRCFIVFSIYLKLRPASRLSATDAASVTEEPSLRERLSTRRKLRNVEVRMRPLTKFHVYLHLISSNDKFTYPISVTSRQNSRLRTALGVRLQGNAKRPA